MRSYAAAGVDIDEGAHAVDQIRAAVERTHGAEVVQGLGSFGGVFSAKAIAAMDEPVLVASTDGVGTKVELAARTGRCAGSATTSSTTASTTCWCRRRARCSSSTTSPPAASTPTSSPSVVAGMAEACEAAGCPLLGGETAEMPGVYTPGSLDVAGTLVGVAERSGLLPRPDVPVGDVLIGVESSGPHTNGYSLLRRLFDWIPLDVTPSGLDRPLADALLEPHRSYLRVLEPALATGSVKALAHITGGGLVDNVPRVLPEGVDARIDLASWPRPPLFALVAELATGLEPGELYRTLNMGIGMVVVCARPTSMP